MDVDSNPDPDAQEPTPQPRPPASVWNRFWVPYSEFRPVRGTHAEKQAALRYNATWMEKWGGTYVLRWLVAFALAHWVVAFAHDTGVELLVMVAGWLYYFTLLGLLWMVWVRYTVISFVKGRKERD